MNDIEKCSSCYHFVWNTVDIKKGGNCYFAPPILHVLPAQNPLTGQVGAQVMATRPQLTGEEFSCGQHDFCDLGCTRVLGDSPLLESVKQIPT